MIEGKKKSLVRQHKTGKLLPTALFAISFILSSQR